eukprot:10869547-Heterocapsa_arctica.AAC.1
MIMCIAPGIALIMLFECCAAGGNPGTNKISCNTLYCPEMDTPLCSATVISTSGKTNTSWNLH